MKKIFFIFVVFAVMFLIVGCGGNSSNNDGDNEDGSWSCTTQGAFRCIDDYLQKCDEKEWKNFEKCEVGKTCNAKKGTCETTSDNNNGDNGNYEGNDSNNDAGIHLGIIGFNNTLKTKDIARLTNTNTFINFIEGLERENNTALYYADDEALKLMQNYNEPPKLQNVALVTFTDGIDNQSISLASGYDDPDDYRDDLHEKIINEKIHGLSVQAYSIGLRTKEEIPDVLLPDFDEALKKLASNDNNAFSVSDINEVQERFAEIANNLAKVSKSIDMGVYTPAGYKDGQVIRYTFDDVSAESVETSKLYIEATFSKQNKALEKISYKGLKGDSSVQSKEGPKGSLYFLFKNLRYSNGESVSQDLRNSARLWKQIKGEWISESEISMEDLPPVVEVDLSSALIMLVLDCTTSLSQSNFEMMKYAAEEFVKTLANATSGNNGGNNSGGDNGGNNSGGNNGGNSDDSCSLDSSIINSTASSYFAYQGIGKIQSGSGTADWNSSDSVTVKFSGIPGKTKEIAEYASTFIRFTATWEDGSEEDMIGVVVRDNPDDANYFTSDIQAMVQINFIDLMQEEGIFELPLAPYLLFYDWTWTSDHNYYKACLIANNKVEYNSYFDGDTRVGKMRVCYEDNYDFSVGETFKVALFAELITGQELLDDTGVNYAEDLCSCYNSENSQVDCSDIDF